MVLGLSGQPPEDADLGELFARPRKGRVLAPGFRSGVNSARAQREPGWAQLPQNCWEKVFNTSNIT